MPGLQIEFTDDTLVYTEQGIERLATLLERPVSQCLWAVKWKFRDIPNGISFHKSHKSAKLFSESQIDSSPEGPARLVDVSDFIYKYVASHDYCLTNLKSFEEAATFKGDVCNH